MKIYVSDRRAASLILLSLALLVCAQAASAQQALTWTQVQARFFASNPSLQADADYVREMKASEITAGLRPNPQFSLSQDGTQIAPHDGVWQPFTGTYIVPTISYLHERRHKRELREESAKQGASIAASEHSDLERNLLFNLRSQFIDVLEAKATLALAQQDLQYYDRIIAISHDRYKAGDMAQIDLDRIDLQRVQYISDLQTAEVSLRTAKIELLQLLHDPTPVDRFDIQGSFDFSDQLPPLPSIQQIALAHRPDLRAAMQTLQQARTNHKLAVANGSTDPTFSGWYTWNASTNNPNATQTIGASVSIPLRIFDRNQGEKQRTAIDIERDQQMEEAARDQVFSDVDTAYAQVGSNLTLLQAYKQQYLTQALHVRDTVTYAWQHGGASLLDFLNAQSDYRNVELSYLQLIGAYQTSAAQLNLAVGYEVISCN
jgi:cobalt-zinc-cadmium efflux system outer membrane protein